MHDIGLDRQILINKISGIGAVGMNAAHLGRRQEYIFGLFFLEKFPYRMLIGEVQFCVSAGDNVAVLAHPCAHRTWASCPARVAARV